MPDESQAEDASPAGSPIYAKTMAELRAMSDNELVRQHDLMVTQMGHPRYVVQLGYYLDELRRRDAAEQAGRTIYLARLSLGVAIVAALAAIIAVILSA